MNDDPLEWQIQTLRGELLELGSAIRQLNRSGLDSATAQLLMSRKRAELEVRTRETATWLRCAREWDGWGRISDDGSGHYDPGLSEGPWGGGAMTLHGGAQSSRRPDAERDNR